MGAPCPRHRLVTLAFSSSCLSSSFSAAACAPSRLTRIHTFVRGCPSLPPEHVTVASRWQSASAESEFHRCAASHFSRSELNRPCSTRNGDPFAVPWRAGLHDEPFPGPLLNDEHLLAFPFVARLTAPSNRPVTWSAIAARARPSVRSRTRPLRGRLPRMPPRLDGSRLSGLDGGPAVVRVAILDCRPGWVMSFGNVMRCVI